MGIQESIKEAAERQKAMQDALRKESEEMSRENEETTGDQTTPGSPTS